MTGIAVSQPTKSDQIQWLQLWSLAALYTSILIGWIAYENYQPKLLVQFSFTEFSFLLIVAQAIILVATPPIAGRLGDRFRQNKGHRIPIISGGISFAAMVFMAVAFTLLSNPGEVFKWILPILIIFWLIAMSIFTSPALSTIELFTPVEKLPTAMALFTIIGNLMYALEPVVVDIIDFLGAPVTFLAGGAVVFISGFALKKNSLVLFKQSNDHEAESASEDVPFGFSQLLMLFGLGAILGLATTSLIEVFPKLFQQYISNSVDVNGKVILVVMLVISAMLSWPLSKFAGSFGVQKLFIISFAGIILSGLGIMVVTSAPVLLLLASVFTIAFTSLSVTALPLAIQKANAAHKVFCVGVFFSGVALADGIIKVALAS